MKDRQTDGQQGMIMNRREPKSLDDIFHNQNLAFSKTGGLSRQPAQNQPSPRVTPTTKPAHAPGRGNVAWLEDSARPAINLEGGGNVFAKQGPEVRTDTTRFTPPC